MLKPFAGAAALAAIISAGVLLLPSPAKDLSGAEDRSSCSEPGNRLHLEREALMPVPDSVLPSSIAARSAADVILIDQGFSNVLAISAGGTAPLAHLGSGFHGLALSDPEPLLLRGRDIFFLPEGRGTPSIVDLRPSVASEVLAAAGSAERIWLIAERGTRFFSSPVQPRPAVLFSFRRSTGQSSPHYSLADSAALPGPGHLHPVGTGVLYTAMHSPHLVMLFDSALTLRGSSRPIDLGSHVTAPPHSPIVEFVTAAILPLDCERALQVLTDLRSDKRWLVLHDLGKFRVLRSSMIEAPVALTQSLVDAKVLIGFSDAPGDRGVVSYRWRWK